MMKKCSSQKETEEVSHPISKARSDRFGHYPKWAADGFGSRCIH
jgi:hypothetical protein